MSKHTKALAKLCSTPPPSGFKWTELKALLEHLGFKCINGTGSRRKFFHEAKNVLIICHQPHPSPDVDKGCVVDVAATLVAHGFDKE